jgi:hypothetical protein
VLRPRSLLVALLACAAICAVAAPAGAATKPFSLAISPASFAAGATVTAGATLTDLTDQQQLGSANITAPSGFTVVSASVPGPATAAVSGSVVQLRNLALQPHQSVTLSIVVKAPCAATSSSWSVIAKQSNDFNGPPGNAMNLDPGASSLSASVASGCALRFFTQPHRARTSDTISGSDYSPAGSAVAVEMIDGSGHRVTSSSASITMQLGPSSTGLGALSGTKTVSAVNGLASFSTLSIDDAGAYTLLATSPGATPATSTPFRIDDVAVSCTPGVDCSGSISSRNLSANVTAFSGGLTSGSDFLTFSLDNGPVLDCAGYTEMSPDWVVVEATSSARTKSATLIIPKRLMNAVANNGASFIEMCFGAPEPFTVKPGTTRTVLNVDVDGDGVLDNWYEGLLPDCSPGFPPPCVSSRKKTGSGDGVITATLPASGADPHMRG